jgi:iron complex outermembrane receptor protein
MVSITAFPVIAATPPSEDLTDLSLEELTTIEVTSISKKSQLVTQDDIRRSSANRIPEALRTVPGLHVARIDSQKWGFCIK